MTLVLTPEAENSDCKKKLTKAEIIAYLTGDEPDFTPKPAKKEKNEQPAQPDI